MDTILAGATAPAAGDTRIKGKGLPDRDKLRRRMEALKAARRNWETRWKAIRDYELPYIGQFEDTSDETNPARRRDLNIAQGVAWLSAQVMSAGIMSGLTPPSRQWFKFSFSDEKLNDNVAALQVLDQRQEILQSVLAKSNFYNAVHTVYLELPFGQCPLGVFQDLKTGVRFVPMTIGTYYLDVDGAGKVNTIARRFKLNASQLTKLFGIENLPETIRASVQNGSVNWNKTYAVNWLCEPNDDSVPGKIDRLNLPYKSIYWLDESNANEYLYVGGFEEFPCPTARYLVNGNDPYAKGPGWFAEGDSKALQVMKRDFLTAVELYIKPPMQASPDVMMSGINLIPGGMTPTNGQSIVQPLFNVQANLQYMSQEIQSTEDRIKRAYSADLFLMLDRFEPGRMTAKEVTIRQQEKLQQLGPVTERLQDEFLTLIIERVYNILDRAGVFPPLPDDLQQLINADVKVEYISPLAQAQKMSGLVNIEQGIGFVMQMAQAWPDALKTVDPTKTVAKYLTMLGAPADMRRSPEEIEKLIQQEQQALQEQQDQQRAMEVAQTVPGITQAAKNATKAANDGNPALKEWLGMG